MAEPVRHRQTKGAATDMFDLQPPRHISTLRISPVAECPDQGPLTEPAADARARGWGLLLLPHLRHSLEAQFPDESQAPARSRSRVLCAEDERRNDTMDIGGWLRGLGLDRYEQAFRENEIDEEVLPGLTADDLKDLGVALVGHRRRLLDAIAALGAAPPPAVAPAREERGVAVAAEAERRQLTVMFCDLVGSTPLSTRFDPEDLREIVGAYNRCVTDTVGCFGGFVARYMGDGGARLFRLSRGA